MTHVPLEKVKGEKEERREKRRKGGGTKEGRKLNEMQGKIKEH